MEVSIDKELCTGCGLCADNVPEVFKMEGDVATVIQEEVDGALADKAKDAAADCPVEAIRVE